MHRSRAEQSDVLDDSPFPSPPFALRPLIHERAHDLANLRRQLLAVPADLDGLHLVQGVPQVQGLAEGKVVQLQPLNCKVAPPGPAPPLIFTPLARLAAANWGGHARVPLEVPTLVDTEDENDRLGSLEERKNNLSETQASLAGDARNMPNWWRK